MSLKIIFFTQFHFILIFFKNPKIFSFLFLFFLLINFFSSYTSTLKNFFPSKISYTFIGWALVCDWDPESLMEFYYISHDTHGILWMNIVCFGYILAANSTRILARMRRGKFIWRLPELECTFKFPDSASVLPLTHFPATHNLAFILCRSAIYWF